MKKRSLISNRKNAKPSIGEKIVIEYLRKNKIKFSREHFFDDCVNPQTRCHLFFDFYISSLKLVIEVDGSQHHTPYNGDRQKFDSLVYRDGIKNQYCLERGIEMLRLTYDQLKPPYRELSNAVGGVLYTRRVLKQKKGWSSEKQKIKKQKYKSGKNKQYRDPVKITKIKIAEKVKAKQEAWLTEIFNKRAEARMRYPNDIKKKLGL